MGLAHVHLMKVLNWYLKELTVYSSTNIRLTVTLRLTTSQTALPRTLQNIH